MPLLRQELLVGGGVHQSGEIGVRDLELGDPAVAERGFVDFLGGFFQRGVDLDRWCPLDFACAPFLERIPDHSRPWTSDEIVPVPRGAGT